MDDFLTKMYEDEMEKTSAAELDNFMGSLSVEELEGLLGLDSVDFTKVAVAGPVEPPMPDSLPGNELDAQMKTVEEIAAKSRTDTPPTRQQEAEPTAVSHQGPGKVPTTKEAMAWADHIGRIFAKQAAATPDWYDRQVQAAQAAQESRPLQMIGGGALGGLTGAGLGGAVGGGKGALLGGLLGAGAGTGLGALGAHMAGKRRKVIQDVAAGKEPEGFIAKRMAAQQAMQESPGLRTGLGAVGGGLGGAMMGGQAGGGKGALLGGLLGAGVGGGLGYLGSKLSKKERKALQSMKTAAVKAEIAQRALRATVGAPPHVKQAAAKVAALQITAACKKMSQYGEEEGMEKEDEFTTPEARVKAKAMAAAMKQGKGKPSAVRKQMVSSVGKHF
jgi:hypothetical protein